MYLKPIDGRVGTFTLSYDYNPAGELKKITDATDQSGVYQDTTMTFDGYGRLQSKRVPEQNSGTATTYTYNNDDTINSVTDARGVTATFGYNARHLMTSITYPPAQNLPAGVAATSDVSFGYDPAGNRISMTDGLGSVSYSYNQLSQLMSETRTFTSIVTLKPERRSLLLRWEVDDEKYLCTSIISKSQPPRTNPPRADNFWSACLHPRLPFR